MLSVLRHYGSVAACYLRLTFQQQLEYPLFLVSWMLMIPIQYFAGIYLLKVIIDHFRHLNGWTYPDLVFIFGLGLLSHGLMVVFFINSWMIGRMVIDGTFDRLLLRPMNVFFQLIASYFNFIGLIDLIPGIIIFLYACSLVGFEWTLPNILKLVLILAGAVLIRAALFVMIGSIAFWTKKNAAVHNFALVILERTTMYPLNLYPYLIQALFTFVIPIGFISFYPASAFLDRDRFVLPFDLAILTPVIGLVFYGLSQLIFNWGLRKYESAGT